MAEKKRVNENLGRGRTIGVGVGRVSAGEVLEGDGLSLRRRENGTQYRQLRNTVREGD